MTDQPTNHEDDDDDSFDAFVILHQPQGSEPYAIGPYPPIGELAELVLVGTHCECVKSVVWTAFPKGVRMAIVPDPEALAAVLNSTPEGQVH